MVKKKFQPPSKWFMICHRQAAKQGIEKDSITGTNKRKDFVEACIKSMKSKSKEKQ